MAESEDSGEENFYGIYAGSPLRWRPMLKSPVTVEVLLDEGDVCMLLSSSYVCTRLEYFIMDECHQRNAKSVEIVAGCVTKKPAWCIMFSL